MGDDQTSSGELVARVGTFLLLLGFFFFIIFLASDFADRTDFDWLFLGLLIAGIGFVLRRRAAPPPPSGRFGTVRSIREKAKQRREERSKKTRRK